jgi:hypothetical protein
MDPHEFASHDFRTGIQSTNMGHLRTNAKESGLGKLDQRFNGI